MSAVEGVREAAQKARSIRGCPTLARAALAEMEEKFATLAEDEKADAQREVETSRKSVTQSLASWTADAARFHLKTALRETDAAAEGYRLASFDEFDTLSQSVEDLLADEVNVGLLSAHEIDTARTKLGTAKHAYREAVLKSAAKSWTKLDELRKVNHGWEDDAANDIAKVVRTSQLGCEKSANMAQSAQKVLVDPIFLGAISRYPDAGELLQIRDEATATHNQAVANVRKIHELILSAAEQLSPGKERAQMVARYRESCSARLL